MPNLYFRYKLPARYKRSARMNNTQLAIQFFLQIAVILAFCRIVGAIAGRLGQPQVVAEMIAGVLLGPSLFGLFWPETQNWLFPWDKTQTLRDTQSYLFPASQLGLALYMFVVGMEFRVDIIQKKLKSSIAVSLAGMLVPFVLGAALGWVFFHHTELFPKKTSLFEAMLFLGASMCITAFPMLARIIHFKKLTGTTMGTVAIGAGALDDAMAWCLLAVVLASFDNNWSHAIVNIAGGASYVFVTLGLIRPALARLQKFLVRDGSLTEAGLVVSLALMALGAWITDRIGLHAVFGAFVMGAAIPRGIVVRDLIARVQPLTVALLLPLFFTYSGLNTKIGLLNTGFLWMMCAAVLFAAVVGKGVACWWAARATGISNREAMGIGVLMNARGLMELIIINVGLQRGIISEGLFATLVIMAVVTTLMASPIFERLVGSTHQPVPEPEACPSTPPFPGGFLEGTTSRPL
jgi:Kef-type K+ transport system membrane component KefB